MKKLAISAVAITALLSSTSVFAAPAPGGTHGLAVGNGGFAPGYTAPAVAPFWGANGSNHDGSAGMPNDDNVDSPTVTRNFILQGEVAKNCSYFINSASNTQTIDLGAIGIHNGDNQAVGTLFNQVDTINVDNQSTGAGCNTDNTVTVTKTNGPKGLVNGTPGDFDSSQFTSSIPYSLTVGFQDAVLQGAGSQPGSFQSFQVATTAKTGTLNLGAWRSLINVHATIPPQSLGLVAGTYSDTIVVTLAAL
jgi:hypothetical protein